MSSKDRTKYNFEEMRLGKGPLVLALIRRYLHDHPFSKFEELHMAFPDELQADSPTQFDKKVQCVVRRRSDIPLASLKRFFWKDPIQLGDDVVLVSREWNVDNIQNVLARAKSLGYRVEISPPPTACERRPSVHSDANPQPLYETEPSTVPETEPSKTRAGK